MESAVGAHLVMAELRAGSGAAGFSPAHVERVEAWEEMARSPGTRVAEFEGGSVAILECRGRDFCRVVTSIRYRFHLQYAPEGAQWCTRRVLS